MTNVRYSDQFKRDAVRLVTQEGYSKKAAAQAVGVCHTTLKSWLLRYGDEAPQRTVFASQQDELEHLRAENRRLRMQRDILKKAAAYFAQQEMTL
jgi:transposase